MSLFTSPARMKARYCQSIKYTPTDDMSIRKKYSVATAGPGILVFVFKCVLFFSKGHNYKLMIY